MCKLLKLSHVNTVLSVQCHVSVTANPSSFRYWRLSSVLYGMVMNAYKQQRWIPRLIHSGSPDGNDCWWWHWNNDVRDVAQINRSCEWPCACRPWVVCGGRDAAWRRRRCGGAGRRRGVRGEWARAALRSRLPRAAWPAAAPPPTPARRAARAGGPGPATPYRFTISRKREGHSPIQVRVAMFVLYRITRTLVWLPRCKHKG